MGVKKEARVVPMDEINAMPMKICEVCKTDLEQTKVPWWVTTREPVKFTCTFCDYKQKAEEWRKTGCLTGRVITDCYCAFHFPESNYAEVRAAFHKREIERIAALSDAFHGAIKVFERRVWFAGGVQKYIRESKHSGHSAEVGGFKVLAFATAGRVMFTISKADDENVNISVIEDETSPEPRGGLQSFYGTERDAYELLSIAVTAKDFKPDTKVSIL